MAEAVTDKFAPEQPASLQLKAIIERIERLEEEKKTISDDIRDVYAEGKGNGFDVKALRAVIPSQVPLLPGGLVYAESDQPFAEPPAAWLQGWQVVRADKAGQVCFALLMADDNGLI